MDFADLRGTRALVIDGNPTSRSLLVSMLRDLGVGVIAQVSDAAAARRDLDTRRFDVVLCDYHFDGSDYTGQDLLDDLHRAQLLPFSTVFIMVTGEASYAKVAEAAESALDSYLLKPHNASALADRIRLARGRKQELRDVFEAIESGDLPRAARLSVQHFTARSRYWSHAGRVGAELLLRLGQHDAAERLYESLSELRPQPWTRLGIARAQVDAGRLDDARQTLDRLIEQEPTYADAYDVLGPLLVELGDLEAALGAYRVASALTPYSVPRLQKQGSLAFFLGRQDEALDSLDRSVSVGIGSKRFDPQGVMLLALARFDRGDAKGLRRCEEHLAQLREQWRDKRAGADTRLERLATLIELLTLAGRSAVREGIDQRLEALAAELRLPGFDFEAGCNTLAVLARLRASEFELPDEETWIAGIGRRHATSKAAAELLAHAAAPCPAHAERIRRTHAEILSLAERAMTLSLGGDPGGAAQELLLHGGETLNAKLIDMAQMVLRRHRSRIAGADVLEETALDLRRCYGRPGSPGQLGQSGAPRQPGGLNLRALPSTAALDLA